MGVTILISSQKKGQFQFQMIIFLRGNWDGFQEKHLISPVELPKSLLKPF